MSEPDSHQRVEATEAALKAIQALQAARGPVMFFQSGGCCDGSLPLCLDEGEMVLGPGDILLGQLEGCPFYMDERQYAALGRPRMTLDVAPGAPEGFSLPAGDDAHFVVLSPLP